VNPEQASKVLMRPPTWPLRGEGRCVSGKQPTSAPGTGAGVVGAAREEGSLGNVGGPDWEAGSRLATALLVPVLPGVGEAHGVRWAARWSGGLKSLRRSNEERRIQRRE
jgi:hypothetical protein